MDTRAQEQEITTLFERVRGEFLEMPGLRLTSAQAQRLWAIDEARCQAIFGELIESRFLVRTQNGAFVHA